MSSEDKPPVPKFTTFDFQHKGLTIEGLYFTLQPGSLEPVMRVRITDGGGAGINGVVKLREVAEALRIDRNSGDGHLLQIVERSLRHVSQIRPGDRIPTEILDGTASWTVDERHRERMAISLAETLLGALGAGVAEGMLASGDAAMDRLKGVAETLCDRLELPKDRRGEAVERIERLVNELAFVEALRDHFRPLTDVPRQLRDIAKRNTGDTEFADQIATTQRLLKEQLPRLRALWDETFASVADPVAALKAVDKTVKRIRQRRDALHFESLRWGDLPATWKAVDTGSEEGAWQAGQLYRFMLRNFMQVKSWAGGG